MIYVDGNGNVLEFVNLSIGYLEDLEWIDHDAEPEQGHYEYEDLIRTITDILPPEDPDGEPVEVERTEIVGQLQKYIIDSPAKAAWREVTKQKYILYDEAQLAEIAKNDIQGRLLNLEVKAESQEQINDKQEQVNTLASAQIQAVSDRGDFVEDVIAEMAGVVYG